MIKKNRTRLEISVTKEDKEYLKTILKEHNLTFSKYIRMCIYNSELNLECLTIDRQKIFLLSKISNNINQIAKHCNSIKEIDLICLTQLNDILVLLKNHSHSGG